jgi:hypothetical protein
MTKHHSQSHYHSQQQAQNNDNIVIQAPNQPATHPDIPVISRRAQTQACTTLSSP